MLVVTMDARVIMWPTVIQNIRSRQCHKWIAVVKTVDRIDVKPNLESGL